MPGAPYLGHWRLAMKANSSSSTLMKPLALVNHGGGIDLWR